MNETNLENRRILACIDVKKDYGHYTLYFTENEMSAAKTGIPRILWQVIVVCGFIGVILFGIVFGALIQYHGTLELMDRIQVTLIFLACCVLISGPYSYAKWRQKKQMKKFLDAPESILAANKKNFEIDYDDIIRIEMHPVGRIGAAKINVVTDITEYKFPIVKKENFNYYMDLLLPILPGKVRVYR